MRGVTGRGGYAAGVPWSEISWALWAAYLLVEATGLYFAVDVVMRGRTAQGAIAWALALIFLPLLAVPLYLVFGERKFDGYVHARRRGNRGLDKVAAELDQELKEFARAAGPGMGPLVRLARTPVTGGNAADLLIDGEATFAAIFAAVARAERYVLVQFYIFRDDGLGRRLRDALVEASRRGVKVFLLYDEIGSYGLPGSYLQSLREGGVRCSGFRTKPRKQRRFRLNFRNHRKIVVVDGREAFVGGHNVGDEYLGLSPKFGPWRDTHMAVRGPAALCAQLAFVEDWYWANRAVPDIGWAPVAAGGGEDTRVLVVPSGPADTLETCALLYTHVANAAKKRLWIATPYFVPDELTLGALQLASLRGVDVRVIIPEATDSRLVWFSAFSYYNEVLPAGIRLFRYRAGFMHQKVVLSDDIACIGTANFDNRSFRINFEVSAVIEDAAVAARVGEMLEADLARCREVRPGDFERKGFWFRLASRVSRLLAPIQ